MVQCSGSNKSWKNCIYVHYSVNWFVYLLQGLKDDVLPETLSSLKIVLPEKKSSLTLDPLKQMVIITP